MEFFSNFNWAVPVAFSDAVSLCYFEEGDVFYDRQSAYEGDWTIASQKIINSIQVRASANSINQADNQGKNIFENNWDSKITIDLYESLNKKRSISTTQGKLYSVLWKGDINILDSQRMPEKPLRLNSVMRMLDTIKPHFLNSLNDHHFFILPRDNATSLSKNKYRKLLSHLRKHLYSDPELLSPKEAGFEKWEQISPTIDIAVFRLSSLSEKELHELVKAAVYVPSKGAKKSMFRLAKHGMIL